MFWKSLFLASFLAILAFPNLDAQILSVTVRIRGETCNPGCYKLLKDNMKRVKGVRDVTVNPSSSYLQLTWDPKVPFSYYNVNGALQMVGVGLIDMGIKASGYIKKSGNKLTLVSTPDNTIFVLLSPQSPDVNQFTPVTSPMLQNLSGDLKSEILQKSPNKIVTIEGNIYRWYAPPPIYVVLSRVSFESPKK